MLERYVLLTALHWAKRWAIGQSWILSLQPYSRVQEAPGSRTLLSSFSPFPIVIQLLKQLFCN